MFSGYQKPFLTDESKNITKFISYHKISKYDSYLVRESTVMSVIEAYAFAQSM